MKLEQQVTSLETSKRLKELGMNQISEFGWSDWDNHNSESRLQFKLLYEDWAGEGGTHYAAFTASELAEMLPKVEVYFPYISDSERGVRWNLYIFHTGRDWRVEYAWQNIGSRKAKFAFDNESLVEALAACLIYLKENKLI